MHARNSEPAMSAIKRWEGKEEVAVQEQRPEQLSGVCGSSQRRHGPFWGTV